MSRRRPALGLALLAAALLADPASAQDGERRHSLAPGAWALQFGIGPDFIVHSFSGSTISIKRHASASTAFRLGFTPQLRSSDLERAFDEPDSVFQTRDDRWSAVGIDLHVVRYPRPGRTVNLFYGAGPEVFWSRVRDAETFDDQSREFERTTWGIGLEGFIGAEWFASRAIGLHAEYGTIVAWSSIRESRIYSDLPALNTTETRKGWTVEGRGVRFGASLYF